MSFNEKDLYTLAISLVKETEFELNFESKVISLLEAIMDKNPEAIELVFRGVDEETKDEIAEAANLAVVKAQTKIEEDILDNGSIEEIEVLNDFKEAQMRIFENL